MRNSKTPKKDKNPLNGLKISLNELVGFCFDLNCYVIPNPISNDRMKLIAVDKGKQIESKKTYSLKEFKVKQLEFFLYFYNKYNT